MYEFLAGDLASKGPTEVVLDCGGVGYLVHISLNTYADLPDHGPVRLLVHPHYAENSQRLFGFTSAQERMLFRLLQGVRGIGPSLAINLLSHERPEKLIARLRSGDAGSLTRIKGIGRKTAERLLVELKDRLPEIAVVDAAHPSLEAVLVQALSSLGLNVPEAELRARRAMQAEPDETRVDVLLRACLQEGQRSAAG